jgi:uncharacterized phage protein gp47/JayE
MAGLDTTGFTAKTLNELITEIGVDLQNSQQFGLGVNLDFDGPVGQLIGTFSTQLALVWSALRQLYDSRDPDQAEGTHLDNLAAIVGVNRLEATFSEVELTLSGTPNITIPANSQVKIPDGEVFIIQADATLDGGGSATGVLALAENTGPITGAIGAVSQIVTQVAGWSSVTNPAAVVPGQDRELDSELRIRRESSLQIVGAGPDQAIRARLEAIDQVQAAVVISNRTLVTDSFGIPGKSFRAVVWPSSPDPVEIATAIYNTQPAGIYSDGAVEVDITDDQGFTQTIRYSIATSLDLYLEVVITTSPEYPADGDDQVETALFEAYNVLSVGDDVILLDGICAVAGISGVLTAELRAKFGSAPGPGDTSNLTVDLTQIALITTDPGRITVTVV